MASSLPAVERTKVSKLAEFGAHLFRTRQHWLDLSSLLSAEDMMAQAMEDASPTTWHLAHVTPPRLLVLRSASARKSYRIRSRPILSLRRSGR